jgi:hypothetical protein
MDTNLLLGFLILGLGYWVHGARITPRNTVGDIGSIACLGGVLEVFGI